MGVKFNNENKNLLSIGNINSRMIVMGNNEAFDITMKKIESQYQQREKSKAKCLKQSNAMRLSNTKNGFQNQSNKGNLLETIKNMASNIKSNKSSSSMKTTSLSTLSNMTIRNISKPTNMSMSDVNKASKMNSTNNMSNILG